MTKTIKTAPYSPFNYLQTEDEIKRFFEDAMNDENPQVFINALSHWVRHHGVSEVAESTGLNGDFQSQGVNDLVDGFKGEIAVGR